MDMLYLYQEKVFSFNDRFRLLTYTDLVQDYSRRNTDTQYWVWEGYLQFLQCTLVETVLEEMLLFLTQV